MYCDEGVVDPTMTKTIWILRLGLLHACAHVYAHVPWGSPMPEDPGYPSDSDDEGQQSSSGASPAASAVNIPAPPAETGVYDGEALSSQANEAHALKTLEAVHSLKGEIECLEKQDPQPLQNAELLADPLSPFRACQTEPWDTSCVPSTVHEILRQTGLRAWQPGKGDTEEQCLLRIRKMCPAIRALVAKTRFHEGILSKAVISGKVGPKLGMHHRFEHLLARLRRKYCLQGVRQSRFSAWSFFSKEVANNACNKAKSPDVASEITKFVPSCSTGDGGARTYQLLAVRLHVVGKAKLALVEEVIRGSLAKSGRRTGKKLCEHQLDAHMTALIRAVLLEPLSGPAIDHPELEQNCLLACSCFSPATILDLSDEEGPVLWTVPTSQFEVEETSTRLLFRVKKAAVDALSSSFGTGVVPDFSKKNQTESDQPSVSVSYTPEAFRQRKNVLQYVEVMRRLLQKMLAWLGIVPLCSVYVFCFGGLGGSCVPYISI